MQRCKCVAGGLPMAVKILLIAGSRTLMRLCTPVAPVGDLGPLLCVVPTVRNSDTGILRCGGSRYRPCVRYAAHPGGGGWGGGGRRDGLTLGARAETVLLQWHTAWSHVCKDRARGGKQGMAGTHRHQLRHVAVARVFCRCEQCRQPAMLQDTRSADPSASQQCTLAQASLLQRGSPASALSRQLAPAPLHDRGAAALRARLPPQ